MPNAAVPKWQPDSEARSCALCGAAFTFWFRKHHCRMCGRVVCGNCSPTFERYLPTSHVVTPDSQQFLENPNKPHRTCTECGEELRMIWQTLNAGSDHVSSFLVQNVTPSTNNDHLGSCPVCDKPLYKLPESEQEQHVDQCLNKYTEGPIRKRMLISKLGERECKALGECMICYEDFVPGKNVGRLECMCVFHERCILEWFGKKGIGSCPLHNQGD